jgi:hypothetical protein
MTTLAERIDALERAYEYMIEYAKLERAGDSGPTSEIRSQLRRAEEALKALAVLPLSALGAPESPATQPAYEAFLAVVHEDAAKAREAVSLALSQPAVSSRLIDNINGLTHLRALLTDLFLIDETLKAPAD